MSILDQIIRHKKREVAAAMRAVSLEKMKRAARSSPFRPRGFRKALTKAARRPHVIAEVKKRSPSRGLLCKNFDPLKLAAAFEKNGAAALSVLTDRKFFGGSLDSLTRIRRKARIPILRKDFIVHEYQVYESAAAGADAVLLIAAVLKKDEIVHLQKTAARLGLDALVEVHSLKELGKVRGLKGILLGINNRDLKTFRVSLRTTERLMRRVPRGVPAVSESGIFTPADLTRLAKAGVRAVLVGEGLVVQKDPGSALAKLIGYNTHPWSKSKSAASRI